MSLVRDLLGIRGRREKRERKVRKAAEKAASMRTSYAEALREMLNSEADITLRVGFLKLRGNREGFSVSVRASSHFGSAQTTRIIGDQFGDLQERVGHEYVCRVFLSGSRTRSVNSSARAPRRSAYVRLVVRESKTFNSVSALEQWLRSPNGRETTVDSCSIKVTQLSAARLRR
jgi:hypothetical protein